MVGEMSKLTLAYMPKDVSIGDSFDKLPPHMTVLPPFEVANDKKDELFYGYYCLLTAWAETVFEDDPRGVGVSEEAKTAIRTDSDTAIFGSTVVRRIHETNERYPNDFQVLREWLIEKTEEVCGEDASENWIIGDLHISETEEHGLLDACQELAVRSLTLFCKDNKKWRVEDVLEYGG